jgi:hypothetical protein
MTPRFRSSHDAVGPDHRLARELAAQAVDEDLPEDDAAWLHAHLAHCAACRMVAAEYREQRVLLRTLRDATPEPPRDLWARTAAAIEDAGLPGARRRGWTARLSMPQRLPLAPIAGLLVVAVALGAGLLNSTLLQPDHGGAPGGSQPTPIAMAGGQVQFVTVGPDGSLKLSTGRYDAVCPVGAERCGTSSATDSTSLGTNLAALGAIDAVISPNRDHLVVMDTGATGGSVFVVPVKPTSTPVPQQSTEPATPSVAPPSVTPTPESPSAPPSGEPPTPVVITPTPSDSAASAVPSEAPSAGPSESPALSPSPDAVVTPAPGGAIEIVSGVIVVGSVSGYSPDGTRFAFSARPADGSAGPDVYVWQTSELLAHPVTTDHGSVLAGWLGEQLLVSRVVEGVPMTVEVDPSTGLDTVAHPDAMWRPTIGPGQLTAVWWEGTVVPSADGFSWVPGEGRLVLGRWPGDSNPQVLATGPVADWQVRWDETGDVMALWVADGTGIAGRLSLYRVNGESGTVNLQKPLLADEPAYGGFALHDGNLAWSEPILGPDGTPSPTATVWVLAWSGDSVGRLPVPVEGGTTVVR